MKHLLLILSLLTCTISLWSQDKIFENSNWGFDYQGKWSTFSDDYNALDRWIASNLKYPQEAINNKEHGTVVVSCVVEKDGSLSSLEIKQGVSPSLNAEALRLGAIMPKWKCAYNYGVPCRTRNQFSVRFVLPQSSTIQIAETNKPATGTDMDWTNSMGQKIYEGSYPFKNIEGHAKYQYREANDGARIYDGNFVFTSNSFTAKGQFKNDSQVGTWTYTATNASAIINFDTNGRLAGDFSYRFGSAKAEGQCSNGSVFYIIFKDDEFKAEGGFNAGGRYNLPIGKWELLIVNDPNHLYTYESNYHKKPMIVLFDNEGKYTDWYFVDPSTGDKKRPQRGSRTLNGPEGIMRYILSNANKVLSAVLLRESIRKNGYDM